VPRHRLAVCVSESRRRARAPRAGRGVGCLPALAVGRGPHASVDRAMPTLCGQATSRADARVSARWPLNYFSIFLLYSNPCEFKILCRIRLNSENFKTIFVG
jgi:hypothetical protein